MTDKPLDVLIVGGGPIGIELAVACQLNHLSCAVLEAGQIGNTIAWWAPQTRWFSSNDRISISGVPLETPDQTKATREQYLTYLRSIVRQFKLKVHTYSPVESIKKNEVQTFDVSFSHHNRACALASRNVVLAIGGTDSPNKLGIPGEELPHVDGYFREPHRYFQRRVVIVGGRNSAVEAALRAYHCGADVTLVYRGFDLPRASIKYWILPEIDGLIKSGRIQCYFQSIVTKITPQGIELQNCGSCNPSSARQNTQFIPADDVLTMIGYQQDKKLLHNCGIDLVGDSQRPAFDESTMMTNIAGLYVAGTAVAGTQSSSYKIFLENCHIHVERIIDSICGKESAMHPRVNFHSTPEFISQIESMPEV